MDAWQVEDESMLGARLLRQEPDGKRLSPKQIIATRHADAKNCTLGVIAWLTVTQSGQLRTGVRYLPGTPQAVSVKPTGVGPAASASASAALLLPAMPRLKIPASLVIPRNLFQAGRILEMTTVEGEKKNVKMGISVERGMDYERISFEAVKV